MQAVRFQMKIGKVCKLIVFLHIFVFFSGCSIFESTFGYNESQVISLNNPVEISRVFLCSESAAIELNRDNSWWSKKITFKNFELGVIETGYFSKSNIAGIRFRITYQQIHQSLTLDLKATGPYYIDLGAKKALKSLQSKIVGCIST